MEAYERMAIVGQHMLQHAKTADKMESKVLSVGKATPAELEGILEKLAKYA